MANIAILETRERVLAGILLTGAAYFLFSTQDASIKLLVAGISVWQIMFFRSITILGEKGSVRIGGVAVNEIQAWNFADKRPEDEDIAHASYQTTSVYGFGHPLYYQNVIDTLRGRAEAETDGREGLKSLELLIALYLSSRDGKRVALPLEY